MSKHTPGPWHIGLDIIGTKSETGFDRHIVEMLWDDKQGKADARLIAAAPDLLSACQAMLKAMRDAANSEYVGADDFHESILAGIGAIAKAGGNVGRDL